ncbi:hypothetical protein BGZ54_004550 [Gamsiella multidivaricata]|nr:hypothetical protein BGZ54_004550 [Gamsiella multidivaricata]
MCRGFRKWCAKREEFHVLDMSDTVLGINPLNSSGNRGVTALDAGNVHLTNRCTKAISTKEPSLILSPRSNHLRKKMEKLKRQLRNTASLEEDGVAEEESILEDGPLSLDLEVIERKRKWWLEHERGKSTTQEEWIGDEDTDRQSSTLQSNVNHGQSAGNAKPIAGGEHAEDGNEINDQIRHTKGWFDQSTLELNPSILGFEKEEQQYQDLSPSHSLSTNRYLSSSPDSISNCATYTGHTSGDTTNLISSASSIVNLPCSIPTASIPEPKRVATRSETATGATGLYGSSPVSRPPARASEAPIVECISIISSSCSLPAPSFGPPSFEPISTLSCIPRTPPKRSDCGIILGESPTTTRYYSVIPQPLKRSSSPSLPHSFKNTAPTIGNIFAQLAWSPPLRPTVQLSRAQTDPRHGLQREPRQHFSTTTSPKRSATTTLVGRSDDGDREVIIIESSDDEIDGLEVGQRRDMEAKKQKPSQASEQDLSSQDVACLEYQDMVLENGTLSYLM